jgi:hypothetical protein
LTVGRKSVILLLLVIAGAAVYLLWPSDEARIKKLLKEEVRAVEGEDIEGVMDGVSYNYQDERGLSYLLLQRAIERQFARYSDVVVEYENLEVDVDEGRAEARMDLRVIATWGQDRGYYLGDIKEPARLTLELQKSPARKWLITKGSLGGNF